jgi:hypothetical protein
MNFVRAETLQRLERPLNIGSDNTRSYTVIGDTANLAARLERGNRIYGTQILVAETTAQAIGSQFETREIDTIAVKGKTETTRVFELMSATGNYQMNSHGCAKTTSKLDEHTSPRSGIWLRRPSANVSTFGRTTARPACSLSVCKPCAEVLPEKIGMAYGNS